MLGTDREVPHDSTRFTKASSHFQFLKVGDEGGDIGDRIISAVEHHYHQDAVDFLVNVIGEGQDFVKELKRMESVLNNMVKRGTGLVLNVSNSEGTNGEESLVSSTSICLALDALKFFENGIHLLLGQSSERCIIGVQEEQRPVERFSLPQ